MKKTTLFFLAIIAIVLYCCKGTEDRKNLTSVREADQETRNLISNVDTWAKARDLAKTNPKDFIKYIYSVNPDIDRDGEKVSLRYHYFNKKGICNMENKKGIYTKVKFKDEFVVEVIRPNKNKLWVSLLCLNGMLNISDTSGISGDALMEFTIQKGQGLSKYLADDYWAINVAETFGLPIYKGKAQSKKYKITPTQARALVPNTATTQITVHTEPGWKFNLNDDHWTLNGLTSTQFKRKK